MDTPLEETREEKRLEVLVLSYNRKGIRLPCNQCMEGRKIEMKKEDKYREYSVTRLISYRMYHCSMQAELSLSLSF